VAVELAVVHHFEVVGHSSLVELVVVESMAADQADSLGVVE